VTEESDPLSDRERQRLRSRERKLSRGRLVVDNPGLKKLTLDLAQKRRQETAESGSKPKAIRPSRIRKSGSS